jgi:hypothetical protein
VTDATASPPRPGRFLDRLGLLVGTLGSAITILLTLWNAHTKQLIDEQEQELKAFEARLKERSAGIEESKERVERYKWVLSLLPSLTEEDANKRSFTVALVRLALTRDEAEQLFAGLQQSGSQQVRRAAQQGITELQNQDLVRLVSQINADSADERKAATGRLLREYKSSAAAIAQVIGLYSAERLPSLSPSGVINGFYYLAGTDPEAWTPDSVQRAQDAVAAVAARGPGPQTKANMDRLTKFLETLSKARR